jgi:hypothetical protein
MYRPRLPSVQADAKLEKSGRMGGVMMPFGWKNSSADFRAPKRTMTIG